MDPGSPLPCPSKLTLERYGLGELPPVQLTALHAHLRQCERCRKRLEDMDTQAAGYRRTLSALNARDAMHKADTRWWRRTGLALATPVLACALVALVVFALPHLQRTGLGGSQRVQARAIAPGARMVEPRPDTSPRRRAHFVDLRGQRVEFGQGSLEAAPDNGPARPFVLRHTDVEAEITGFVSDVTVTQEFENPFSERVEAIYVFPLPDDAAVHEMVLEVGERKIRGVIQRREEARRTYEQARAEGRHAALLDQERPNIFTQSVANIRPGERVKVSLRYVAPLAYDDGTFEFNFPMVVGPRYMPGQPLDGAPQGTGTSPDTDRVLDASRISPPSAVMDRSGRDIRITVRLNSGVEMEGLESGSHRLWVEQRNAREAVITLPEDDRIPNRDFILRYRTAGEQLRGAVMATGGSDGYFALMLQPAAREASRGEVLPRDVVFVLDTSGSMSGPPLQAVKRAVRRTFQSLSPEDRFMLINFAESASSFRDEPLPATRENLTLAEDYLNALPSGGGTNQLAGIERALSLPREEGRLRVVLLMTDGFIGNEAQIFARTEPLLGDTRLFGFGVGSSVNHYFLDRLSRIGRGFYQYIDTQEDPGEAIERFIRRIERPVLTNVRVDWGGLDVRDVQPERLPDLFDNQPLVVLGRYRKPGSATVRVLGQTPGGEHATAVSVTLPEEGGHARSLRTMWARAQVEELDMARARSPSPELTERITVLGLEYQLMTAFTSFVAVDDAEAPEAVSEARSVVEPTGQPRGVLAMPPPPSHGMAYAPSVMAKPIPRVPSVPPRVVAGLSGSGSSGKKDEPVFLLGGENAGISLKGLDPDSVKGASHNPSTTQERRVGGVVTRASARAVAFQSTQGSINRELVARIINSHLAQVKACYEAGLLKQPDLAGKVVVEWTLSADGKVTGIRVKSSSLMHSPTEACLMMQIKRWVFPKPEGGAVTIAYPFIFQSVGY